ncbi:MAG: anthranilate synthase component I [Rhodospirillaceae bacterium]|jgi:anthranilate synthase component I|nr:anthranilate synthase component I [Rhodospirillaceae bacterium]MBT4587968.1 anthranilate synthase component I [Rhodospirillaceae bacterium]MBT4939526.1 anthranilate synthase component I [Rhodospirillaceae bacterium]MBT5938514.1 anthranilate synthase component I [Rhodospirillaceae bacterium]MBT7265834.1 anthranilate synthase component I [Rhodospirillaceae bacterium]
MQVTPDFSGFESGYRSGLTQVVSTTLGADLETPVSAMIKLAKGQPNSFLLESVEGGSIRGRYSFIGLKPDLIWRCYGDRAELNRDAIDSAESFAPCPVAEKDGVLASFRALLAESKFDLPENMPPMASGLFGYMGYDMVRLAEKVPDENPSTIDVPDGQYIRPTIIAVFDTIEDQVTVVTPVWPKEGLSADAAYEHALSRLGAVLDDFATNLPRNQDDVDLARMPEPSSNMSQDDFHEIVAKAKEYILAGDVFQVVLSQRFSVPFDLPPLAFYRALRRVNPSPFLFFLDFGDFSIVGSSPELLVRLREGRVTIRPLAGTRPRGKTTAEDNALSEDLLADPKELAEHLMLLDLGRNDVGRVAKIGSVEVTDRNKIELYSHVMHIVSNVEGDIDAEKYDEIDALLSGFPAGTVSGAPKVRAMEIIDELETLRRGIYAGCIGYFGANGDMDTCIALRTAVLKDGQLHAQAGAGIVADSDPESEYQECRNKAKALIRAAEEAVKFASGGN